MNNGAVTLATVLVRLAKNESGIRGCADRDAQRHHEQRDATDQRQQHPRRAPGPRGGLQQPIDHAHQAGGRDERTDDVDPAALLADHPVLRHDARHDDQQHQRHRQVDVEDATPGQVRREQPGDDVAHDAADAGQTTPDPQRLGPLPWIGETSADQPQCGGRGKCLTEALREATRNQHPGMEGGAAHRRGDQEDGCADEQHSTPAEDVARRPRRSRNPPAINT